MFGRRRSEPNHNAIANEANSLGAGGSASGHRILAAPTISPSLLPPGSIEVLTAGGHRVRIVPPVDRTTLRLVLEALGR